MTLTPLPQLLADAQARSAAVGAFTCYDLVTGHAVLAAGEHCDVGVILLISAQAARAPAGLALVCGLRVLADRSTVPACLQLDHTDDLLLMRTALDAASAH